MEQPEVIEEMEVNNENNGNEVQPDIGQPEQQLKKLRKTNSK